MNPSSIAFTLVSAAILMALVAWISYIKTRGSVNTREGYFLAGRGLSGTFIAGSLLLTNLSAEQMVGLNGSAYGFNLSAMAWEVTTVVAIVIMALVFLPRYLAGAFTTLPEFLKERFDDDVRRLTVLLFMLGYGLVTIPSVLYSGSIAVLSLFDVPRLFGLDYSTALLLTILVVGIIGAVYAIFGGLRAVAVSDTINGIGLLLVGILVPVFGLMALGSGNVLTGLKILATSQTYKLNAIGSATDPTPFGTLFTGMIFANMFYWGTNQYVIQRTLGASSLAEGQKGVLLAGGFKLMVPLLMMIPGTIAFHLYGPGFASIDMAYPKLVADVLPGFLSGLFLAALLGAVFSSFNSLLNSAATLFVLDIYVPLKKEVPDDASLIRIAKIASVVIAVFGFIISPLLRLAPEGLWQIIRIFTGFYNIPIIAVVLIGLFARRVPALGPKIAIIFHVAAYSLIRFVWQPEMNFVHIYGILFLIEIGIMLAIGKILPRQEAWRHTERSTIEMSPWSGARPAAILLLAGMVGLYITFSPLGLVNGTLVSFGLAIGVLALCTGGLIILTRPRVAEAK